MSEFESSKNKTPNIEAVSLAKSFGDLSFTSNSSDSIPSLYPFTRSKEIFPLISLGSKQDPYSLPEDGTKVPFRPVGELHFIDASGSVAKSADFDIWDPTGQLCFTITIIPNLRNPPDLKEDFDMEVFEARNFEPCTEHTTKYSSQIATRPPSDGSVLFMRLGTFLKEDLQEALDILNLFAARVNVTEFEGKYNLRLLPAESVGFEETIFEKHSPALMPHLHKFVLTGTLKEKP